MTDRLPVLTFHAFESRRSPIAYAPAAFGRALAALRDAGWSTVRLREAARWVGEGAAFPEKTLVLTIDDGYRTLLDAALPALLDHGMTATVFVVTHRSAMHDRPLTGPSDWRRLAAQGFELGAHTMTHPVLTGLDDAGVEREALGSKRRIEDAVGAEVASFAYPSGRVDDRVRRIVARHFACACTTRLAMIRPGDALHALPRIDAHYLRRAAWFGRLDSALLRAYLGGRAALRTLRGTS